MDNFKETQGVEVEQYWAILRRRRWWLIVPVVATWAALMGASWFFPEKYRSETVILVEQQKVPVQFVTPNVSLDIQRRLQTMSEQILSRTRLQHIIETFQLYPRERKHMSMDAVIEMMRKDIDIDLVKSPGKTDVLTGFKIAYSGPTAAIAQRVTGELTSLFIEENLKNRAQLSEDTTAFLQTQLTDAGKDLAEQEQRMREFKNKYLGELPEQLQSNLQILAGLQSRLASATESLHHAEQQKLYLESLRGQYRSLGGEGANLPALDQQLDKLKEQLTQLSAKYTPKHPDVVRIQEEIAKTEQLKKDLQADAKSGKERPSDLADVSLSPDADPKKVRPFMQIESQLKATELDVTNRRREIAGLQAQIESYQGRLNLTPVREQELGDVIRNYQRSRENYDSLLAKQQQSALATNLERRQQGENFRVIDPPSLPEKPYSPDRFKLSLAGIGAGFAIAFVLLVVMEFVNPRIDREGQLKELVAAPVLTTVPGLWTAAEESAKRRWGILQVAAATLCFIFIASATVLVYYFG
ncbi:MAG TPA: XrtA system polysaccharide chain length determinant [Terriglobales bacterium]|nr:XrtA system polysaccharide chain length determinant [Terriglobales bacterium]